MMAVVWVCATLALVLELLIVALNRGLRVGPISATCSAVGAAALIIGLDSQCPPPWIVIMTACAAIAGADQLYRWARGKA